jgi:hypothetical protein
MTHESDTRNHPADEALAAWIDARIGGEGELVEIGRGVAGHLADCPGCRERVRALEAVVAALRAEPPAPTPAELAAARARVVRAVEAGRRAGRRGRVSPLWRWWWVPTAAAAALALLLLARPGDDRPDAGAVAEGPSGARTAEAEATPLPVVVAAQDAADEAARAIGLETAVPETVEGPTDVELSTMSDETALGEVAVLDPSTAPLPGAALADAALGTEFAALGTEDQEAILDELAAMEFQL